MSTLGSWNAENNNFSDVASISNSPTIVTSPVIFGTYCYSLAWANPAPDIRFIEFLNKVTAFIRAYIRINVITPPTVGHFGEGFIYLGDAGATSGGRINASLDTSGALNLQPHLATGAPLGTPVEILENQTYLIELKVVRDPVNGIIEWKIDGTIIGTFTGLDTGSTNIDRLAIFCSSAWSPDGAVGATYVDEVAISDSNYLGPFVPGPGGNLPFITTVGAKRI